MASLPVAVRPLIRALSRAKRRRGLVGAQGGGSLFFVYLAPQARRGRTSNRLFTPAAEIVDRAYLAARLARQTGATAVQDQPVMGMQLEFGGNHEPLRKAGLLRRFAPCNDDEDL